MPEMNGPTARRPDFAGLAIAAALLALAGLIWWDMTALQMNAVYGPGPKAMLIVVAVGLALLAIGNAVMAWRGELPEREHADLKPILLILGGFAILIGLIRWGGGFIPATAILFASTSAGFGRRAFLTDLIIGLVAAVVIYLLFAKLLALTLPTGPIERLF
jgi:putative tricarboxylic transport membrane protein